PRIAAGDHGTVRIERAPRFSLWPALGRSRPALSRATDRAGDRRLLPFSRRRWLSPRSGEGLGITTARLSGITLFGGRCDSATGSDPRSHPGCHGPHPTRRTALSATATESSAVTTVVADLLVVRYALPN